MSTGSSHKNVFYFETVLSHSCFFESEALIYMLIKPEPDPDLSLTIRNFEQTYDALGERMVKVIIDTRHLEMVKFPKEVMDYMSDNPFIKYQLSNALLLNGLGQKILGNFYLNMVRPKVSTKIFTSQANAMDWLKITDQSLVSAEADKLLTLLS